MVCVLVVQVYLTLCNPMDYIACHAPLTMQFSPGKNTRVGCHSLLQGKLPDSEIESESPASQVDSLPSEPQTKTRLE